MYREPLTHDLVECEGYYGLIEAIDSPTYIIRLGNGLCVVKKRSEFRPLSFYVDGTGESPASFHESFIPAPYVFGAAARAITEEARKSTNEAINKATNKRATEEVMLQSPDPQKEAT